MARTIKEIKATTFVPVKGIIHLGAKSNELWKEAKALNVPNKYISHSQDIEYFPDNVWVSKIDFSKESLDSIKEDLATMNYLILEYENNNQKAIDLMSNTLKHIDVIYANTLIALEGFDDIGLGIYARQQKQVELPEMFRDVVPNFIKGGFTEEPKKKGRPFKKKV